MKVKLYTILLLAFPLFISCKKWLPENRIDGTWVLTEVEKRRPFSNETVYTLYQEGQFSFNSNGMAAYNDNYGLMKGSWQMRDVQGPVYYDENGNRQSNSSRVLLIQLYDFSSNRVIDWYFDRFDFRSSGDRLVAFIESPNYTYRYTFRRL